MKKQVIQSHGNLKVFAADFKKEMLKKESEDCVRLKKHNVWQQNCSRVESRQRKLLDAVNLNLKRLAAKDRNFEAYIRKMFSQYKRVGSDFVVLFEKKHGKHREPDYTYSGDAHSLSGQQENVSGSHEVDSVYYIVIRGCHRWGIGDLGVQISGNFSYGYNYWLFSHPDKQYNIPEEVSREMLDILNQLKDRTSALRFFDTNHAHLVKLNAERDDNI